ncbi:hypothetical protein L1987_59268 [Smallanthus sonchifolius]|uniref:Uncharacterized protein n=1 Tax=Smallanthus sonchifolius TaxID=185202 RepID=A0ACB9D4R2_9ASTR|nr:hypothetical protein L1987_59268 [Smallanthus sonchifolius]
MSFYRWPFGCCVYVLFPFSLSTPFTTTRFLFGSRSPWLTNRDTSFVALTSPARFGFPVRLKLGPEGRRPWRTQVISDIGGRQRGKNQEHGYMRESYTS